MSSRGRPVCSRYLSVWRSTGKSALVAPYSGHMFEAVAHDDDLREPLEVHLVADARARRDHAEGLEGLAGPAEERVALAVALVLALEVALVDVLRAEEVSLDRVVDDQVDRDKRLDP